jgi:hypothetical protein
LIAGVRKTGISLPASPAHSHDQALIWIYQISQDLVGAVIKHDRSRGDLDQQIIRRLTGHILGAAPPSILGAVSQLVAISRQGIEYRRNHQDHIAASATIASIGTSPRDIFLTAKMDHAISTFARMHFYYSFINEHDLS